MRARLKRTSNGVATKEKKKSSYKFDVAVLGQAATGVSFLTSVLGLVYLGGKVSPIASLVLFPVVCYSHGKLLLDAGRAGWKKMEEHYKESREE